MINTREAPSVSDVFGPGAAAAVLAGKEAALSLPLTVLVHYPFRRICLLTQRD